MDYIPLDTFLTEEQIGNLTKLRDYLRDHGDPQYFNMRAFFISPAPGYGIEDVIASDFDLDTYRTRVYSPILDDAPHTCNSVACMVGHGPASGVIIELPKDKERSWFHYAAEAFGAKSSDIFHEEAYNDPSGLLWEWLFTDRWSEIDNTLAGGVKRIDITLEKGIPSNVERILEGRADLLPYEVAYD